MHVRELFLPSRRLAFGVAVPLTYLNKVWCALTVAYPGFARGRCPKYYAHAHNVAGRGPAHVKFGSHAPQTRDQIDRPVNSARVASARAYPRVFLAFVGFRWPPIVAGSFE